MQPSENNAGNEPEVTHSCERPLSAASENAPDVIITSLNFPRPEVAEDAPPLIAGNPVCLIGTFDGLGGAGSRKVDGEDGMRSSAYYASRIAADATNIAVETGIVEPLLDPETLAQRLSEAIGKALAQSNAQRPVSSGMVRSSLLRSYPTTAAILLFRRDASVTHATAVWAGDSRCYALSPDTGLQQLSIDDSRIKSDALSALTDDSPMSNMLTGDAPCQLRARQHRFDSPVILLTVSDGAYGCLSSPMHFEHILLEALAKAQDDVDWTTDLRTKYTPIQNDDISISSVFIGWKSLQEASTAFSNRLAFLQKVVEAHSELLDKAAQHEDMAQQAKHMAEQVLRETWERRYQAHYNARIGTES